MVDRIALAVAKDDGQAMADDPTRYRRLAIAALKPLAVPPEAMIDVAHQAVWSDAFCAINSRRDFHKAVRAMITYAIGERAGRVRRPVAANPPCHIAAFCGMGGPSVASDMSVYPVSECFAQAGGNPGTVCPLQVDGCYPVRSETAGTRPTGLGPAMQPTPTCLSGGSVRADGLASRARR